MAIKGVDISYANGNVDFPALKKSGIEFVIIRAGYGKNIESQDDAQFANNIKKAETFGMPYGVYHYSYAKSTQDAKSEADHVLRLLNGKNPAYGVWYDVEDSTISGCNLVAHCQTFCSAMEKAGLYCGIYSMLAWFNSKLNSPLLDKYDKWVAQWSSKCDYKQLYGIWQYTDKLMIGGKRFDGNYAYKDYPAITGNIPKEDYDVTEDKIKEIVKAEMKSSFEEAFKAYRADLAKKPVSEWAKSAVQYAKLIGAMMGDVEDDPDLKHFRPQDFITRQEVAQVIQNYGTRVSHD